MNSPAPVYCSCLLVIRRRNKSRLMVIVPGFPNHHDLINRNVAGFAVSIAQMQDAHLYLDHITTKARSSTAVNVDPLSDKP